MDRVYRKGTVYAAALLAVLAISPISSAWTAEDINLGQFLNKYGETEQFTDAIKVAGGALEAANAVLQLKGQRPLFCTSDAVELTGQQYLAILNGYLKKRPAALDRPSYDWYVAFIAAMDAAFPCK